MAFPVPEQLHFQMRDAFAVEPFIDTIFAQGINRALFQHPGANSGEDIVAVAAFQNDRFNP